MGHNSSYGTSFIIRGNVTKATSYADANNQTGAISVHTQYDADDKVSSITDPLNRTWQYMYTSSPETLKSVTDPLGNTTKYEYASLGRLSKITDPRENEVKKITYNRGVAEFSLRNDTDYERR